MARGQVIGVFAYLDDLEAAMDRVKGTSARVKVVYSPVPLKSIEEALELKPSPVRWFTLIGGILGFFAGLSLAGYAGLQWGFITSGKPVLAWIPFVIVGFEFTILFGILGNVLGLLINARIPRARMPKHYDPRFSLDRFGLLICCSGAEKELVADLLREAGAEDIHEFSK